MTSDEAEAEILYWKEKFESALTELKQTHVNVYRYTLGREPSPRERRRSRELLEARGSTEQ